jgi:hypothetical protein
MTTAIADSLNTAWKHWCEVLEQCGVPSYRWHEPPSADADGHGTISRRFLRFGATHLATPQHVKAILIALSKGKHLLDAALAWELPLAGPAGEAPANPTSRARGEQWRLVMAHGGFETVLAALVPAPRRFTPYADRARHFTDCCPLPPYDPLPAPNRQRAELIRWLQAEENAGEQTMVRFLDLRDGDARVFRHWVVDGRSIDTWPSALQMAKALRNVTAHGALSASKVQQWGLRSAFEALSANLGMVVAAAFRRLAEDGPMPPLPSARNEKMITDLRT